MPKKYKNWVGHISGKLTVVSYSHKNKEHYWNCQCECGRITVIRSSCLNKSKACKCANIKHNKSNSITYRSWKSMKARVKSNAPTIAPYYKDKGINICSEWEDFANFYLDMGERPSLEYSLDRKNIDEGYFKENCRWATASEQQSNKNSPLNISGRIGVSKCHIIGWWRVRLNVNKKSIWVGRFNSFELACSAIEEAEQKLLGYSRSIGYIKKD